MEDRILVTKANRHRLGALELLLPGGVFLRVLVANWSDDAYLGLALIGTALLVTSGPFVLVSILSDTQVRRFVLAWELAGLVLLGVVGLLGSVK